MTQSVTRRTVRAFVIAVSFMITTGVVAAPRSVAELSLHYQASQPRWVPEKQPMFGEYLGSGDGSGSGVLAGGVDWDLYEDQSLIDRSPAFFRGFVERDGHRHPFQIIGIYTPESADRRQWRISGVIVFDDSQLLGELHAPITGTFEASTGSAHYTVWSDHEAK